MCYRKCEQSDEQYGKSVAQTVADHGAEYSGERRILPLCDIARAPQFAEAWEHKVSRVSAEDAEHKNP